MKTALFIIPFFLIILPYFVQIGFYKYSFNRHEHKWRAMHFSIGASFTFYVLAVVLLVIKLFALNILGYIIISMVLLIIIILIIQFRKTEEVQLKQAIKLLIRIYYLISSIAYTILIIYA